MVVTSARIAIEGAQDNENAEVSDDAGKSFFRIKLTAESLK